MQRISTWLMPNVMSVPEIDLSEGRASMISWVVPCGDSSYRQAMVCRVPNQVAARPALKLGGKDKDWGEMTQEEHQRTPGDYEAQAGQGAISLHSEEHLVSSDRGIIMQRRLLLQQCEVVAGGRDPLGVAFEQDKALVHIRSGNFYERRRATG